MLSDVRKLTTKLFWGKDGEPGIKYNSIASVKKHLWEVEINCSKLNNSDNLASYMEKLVCKQLLEE